MTITCKIIMLYITVYESFSKWRSPVQLWGGGLWGCGTALVPLSLHHNYEMHTSCITLIDAPSMIHQGLITSQGVVLYLTN